MEPRKHYFAKIPTIAIFIVMAMSGPLGVLLFILKGIDQKMQKEEQEAARKLKEAQEQQKAKAESASVPVQAKGSNVSEGTDISTVYINK